MDWVEEPLATYIGLSLAIEFFQEDDTAKHEAELTLQYWIKFADYEENCTECKTVA